MNDFNNLNPQTTEKPSLLSLVIKGNLGLWPFITDAYKRNSHYNIRESVTQCLT